MDYFTSQNWWIVLIAAALTAVPLVLLSYRWVQGFQLSSYKFSRFFNWAKNTRSKLFIRLLFISVMSILSLVVINSLFYHLIGDFCVAISGVFAYIYIALYLIAEKKNVKKTPLKFTPRIIRLYAVLAILSIGYGMLGIYTVHLGYYLVFGLLFMLAPVLLPFLLLLAAVIIHPFELLNNRRYIVKAKKKLSRSKVKVIGITGSCGKTTVKNYLYQLLSAKYRCVMTEGNFNTPLGITRTILEKLSDDTEYLILEMGARKPGDIRFLTEIAPVDIAVLTEIAPQHLEYFKTIEAIEHTKFELIEGLKPDGYAVFGGESTQKLFDRCAKPKSAAFLTELTNESVSQNGMAFTVGGEEFCLRVLGRHNIINFLTAMLVAEKEGVSKSELKAVAENIQPQPHRLQLIHGENNIAIIDDTYNSNPVSAKAAIETVARFAGRKLIVTPGFIEQGEYAAAAHRELARQIADVFDGVLLIGAIQTKDILNGLTECGYENEKVRVFRSLTEAQASFKDLISPGDVLLLLNDLPDNYTESI